MLLAYVVISTALLLAVAWIWDRSDLPNILVKSAFGMMGLAGLYFALTLI